MRFRVMSFDTFHDVEADTEEEALREIADKIIEGLKIDPEYLLIAWEEDEND